MKLYEAVRVVPAAAKKEIQAGRLRGMTDINPMWRIKTLTEQFGACGIGWYFDVIKEEFVNGSDDQIAFFVNINLYIKIDGEWSAPIFGNGGSTFISKEKNGLYTDDEVKKKAVTDAIGAACKLLGIGADVYWDKDTTKYSEKPEGTPQQAKVSNNPTTATKPAAQAVNTKPAAPAPVDNDFLANAIAEFKTADDLGRITSVWKKFPTLQKNQDFVNACKEAQFRIKQ